MPKHDGKVLFHGYAFVSLMSVPVLHENAGKQQIRYIAVLIYYHEQWRNLKLKLIQLLDEVMPTLENAR